MPDNVQIVRDSYRAYATGDRAMIERVLADELRFSSPADVDLDRAGYFERCWPNAGHVVRFDLTRLIERGNEVVVTYEAERADGTRFTNTEVHTVEDGRVTRVEVYFGWDLPAA
jgi:ketosteroid isomerase-like protein